MLCSNSHPNKSLKCIKFDKKRTSNCENMIEDEHLLVTFSKHYNIPRVLLVLSHSDDTSLNPMLKHRELK